MKVRQQSPWTRSAYWRKFKYVSNMFLKQHRRWSPRFSPSNPSDVTTPARKTRRGLEFYDGGGRVWSRNTELALICNGLSIPCTALPIVACLGYRKLSVLLRAHMKSKYGVWRGVGYLQLCHFLVNSMQFARYQYYFNKLQRKSSILFDVLDVLSIMVVCFRFVGILLSFRRF